MPLVTTNALEAALRRALRDEERADVADLLAELEAEARAIIDAPLSVTEITEEHSHGGGRLRLRERPVVAVEAVSVDGADWPLVWNDLDPVRGELRIVPTGVVAVTYRAGLPERATAVVRREIIRAAVREVRAAEKRLQGVAKVGVEGASYTFVAGGGDGGFSEAQTARLERLRRRL